MEKEREVMELRDSLGLNDIPFSALLPRMIDNLKDVKKKNKKLFNSLPSDVKKHFEQAVKLVSDDLLPLRQVSRSAPSGRAAVDRELMATRAMQLAEYSVQLGYFLVTSKSFLTFDAGVSSLVHTLMRRNE